MTSLITKFTTRPNKVIKFDSIAAGSPIQGLGYVTKGTGSTTINSFVLGAGTSSSVFSFTATAPLTDAVSLTQVKFSGVANPKVNNTWVVSNRLFFRNTAPGYDVYIFNTRQSTGQVFNVQFYNPTGAGVTIPTITINTVAYYYTAPW